MDTRRRPNQGLKKPKRSNSKYAWISISAMVVFLAIMTVLYMRLTAKTKVEQEPQDAKKYSVHTAPEIQFRKDGTLQFKNDEGFVKSEIEIEIVSTEISRMRGLMFRKEMQENRGMLFIFPSEDERSFWMKNTIIPLDIIFTDNGGKIVYIARNTTPFSEEMIPCPDPAIFVVEVNAGFAERNDIKAGDFISWVEE